MQGFHSNKDISEIKHMLNRAVDIDDEYTYEEFMNEFGGNQNQTSIEDFKIAFKFINKSNNSDPEFATEGSSGFDLRANIPNDGALRIPHGSIKIVPTGLSFEIPNDFEIQIRPRSGLAVKHGITVLNSPGTIDADYRGEIKIILINHSESDYTIKHGDRIAQGVAAHVYGKSIINLISTDFINEYTERGTGGFGSTGKK